MNKLLCRWFGHRFRVTHADYFSWWFYRCRCGLEKKEKGAMWNGKIERGWVND
jgi:hypothetical protein